MIKKKFFSGLFVFVLLFVFSAAPALGSDASLEADLREAEARIEDLDRAAAVVAAVAVEIATEKKVAEFRAATLRWQLYGPSSIELEVGSRIVRVHPRTPGPIRTILLTAPLVVGGGRAVVSLRDLLLISASLHGDVVLEPTSPVRGMVQAKISRPGLRPFTPYFSTGGMIDPWDAVVPLRLTVEEGLRLPIEWNGATRTIRITSLPPGCAPDECG